MGLASQDLLRLPMEWALRRWLSRPAREQGYWAAQCRLTPRSAGRIFGAISVATYAFKFIGEYVGSLSAHGGITVADRERLIVFLEAAPYRVEHDFEKRIDEFQLLVNDLWHCGAAG